MKTRITLLSLAAFALTACSSTPVKSPYPTSAQSRAEYDSASLQMLNAEQMNALVLKKIKRAQEIQKKQDVDDDRGLNAEPEAIDQLRDATRLVFARPDQDGAREHIFSRLRRELTDLNSLEPVLKDLTDEALQALREDSPRSDREKGTYIVLLDNLMAEIKPEVATNKTFRQIIEQIRDANIEIPESVRNQQLLRSMARPVSPSQTAAKILPRK